MITAVDSNVLIDILRRDPDFGAVSQQALESALAAGSVVISMPVYAELASVTEGQLDVDDVLSDLGIAITPSDRRSLRLAGQAWRQYRVRRPQQLSCPQCGHMQTVRCERCGVLLNVRQHLLTDFLVGAHALVHAEQLLTRDPGYYRTYFPELVLA